MLCSCYRTAQAQRKELIDRRRVMAMLVWSQSGVRSEEISSSTGVQFFMSSRGAEIDQAVY